jgi:hypothetical protein
MEDFTEREAQILRWAADGPGIDSTARESDATQDELFALISRLEGEIYTIHREMMVDKRWANRWKRWAWWAFNTMNEKKVEMPSRRVKRAKLAIRQLVDDAKAKKALKKR